MSEQSAPTRPSRSQVRKTGLDMVRSMAVVVVIVAGLYFLVPRTDRVVQPPVDVAAAAQAVGDSGGFEPVVPTGLPDDWRPTSARATAKTDGVVTWQIGYVVGRDEDSAQYVELLQAADPSDRWVREEAGGEADGADVDIAGVTWTERVGADAAQPSLTRDDDGVLIVVGGDDPALVRELAASVPSA